MPPSSIPLALYSPPKPSLPPSRLDDDGISFHQSVPLDCCLFASDSKSRASLSSHEEARNPRVEKGVQERGREEETDHIHSSHDERGIYIISIYYGVRSCDLSKKYL